MASALISKGDRTKRSSPDRIQVSSSPYWYPLGLLALVLCQACGSALTDEDEVRETSSARIELGLMLGEEFEPYAAEADLDVVQGIQGGRWAMPALALTRVDARGDLRVEVSDENGAVLSQLSRPVQLGEADAEERRLMPLLPIPMEVTEGEPAKWDGVPCTVHLEFESESEIVEQAISLKIRIH